MHSLRQICLGKDLRQMEWSLKHLASLQSRPGHSRPARQGRYPKVCAAYALMAASGLESSAINSKSAAIGRGEFTPLDLIHHGNLQNVTKTTRTMFFGDQFVLQKRPLSIRKTLGDKPPTEISKKIQQKNLQEKGRENPVQSANGFHEILCSGFRNSHILIFFSNQILARLLCL